MMRKEGKSEFGWISSKVPIHKMHKFFRKANIKGVVELVNGQQNIVIAIPNLISNKFIEFQQLNRGGGKYNENGNKFRDCIDFNEPYYSYFSQLLWEGRYLDGVRVGKWKIKHFDLQELDFYYMGWGKYSLKGNKVGKWRDLKYVSSSRIIDIIYSFD